MNPVKSRIEILEGLLKELTDAAYSTLCESNGVSDNEWKTENGVAIPDFPMSSFFEAIKKLDAAYTKADGYFNPAEADKLEKWANACSTARYVMQRYREARSEKLEHPNMTESSLERNIADAINGSLVRTVEDEKAGREPGTMMDQLNRLVEEGKLVNYEPERTPRKTRKRK